METSRITGGIYYLATRYPLLVINPQPFLFKYFEPRVREKNMYIIAKAHELQKLVK
jgi:hypothetical protein